MAKRSAILESLRPRGLDLDAYLKGILACLPALTNRQLPEITPANWANARPVPRLIAA